MTSKDPVNTDEYAVWINAYPGSAGHVVRTFPDKDSANCFGATHSGIKKHGGRVERIFTSRTVIATFESESEKVHYPHVNRKR